MSRPDAPLRVAVLSELPTPYRWPLLRCVAERPGLDVTVLFYARTESDRDWDLRVEEGGTRPRVEFLPGRVLSVRGRRSLHFHWNPAIRTRLRDGGFDVVVVPGWSMPTTLAAIAHCRIRGTPYVLFSETHGRTPRPAWLRGAKRVGLRPLVGGAAAWLATGSLSEEFLVRHGARRDRIHRFANTPDVDAFAARCEAARPRRAATRAGLGIPPDASVALCVARLIGAKDPGTLVEAQARVEAAGDAGWLVLVGDGPEAGGLKSRAAELGLGRIVFAGARRPPELPSLFAAADTFVLCSRHEPWGVVVNEAMAAGLPLVLSDRVGAAHDLLEEGGNGFLVPPEDPDATARALSALHADPQAARRMGRRSREIVSDWGYGPSVEGFEAAVRQAAGVDP